MCAAFPRHCRPIYQVMDIPDYPPPSQEFEVNVSPPLWTITAVAFLSGRLAERTGKTVGARCIAPLLSREALAALPRICSTHEHTFLGWMEREREFLEASQLQLHHFDWDKLFAMPLPEVCDVDLLALQHQGGRWAPGLARIEAKVEAACAS